MTTYSFPDASSFRVRTGDVVHIYTDAAATTLAVIKDLSDVVIVGSVLTVPADEVLPSFTATVPDVYAKIVGAAQARHLYGVSGGTVVTKSDVGLGSVDNTADAAKPVSTAQQTALDLKAPLASPALTGTPTAPTQTAADNSTRLATTAYTDAAVVLQHSADNGAYAPLPLSGTLASMPANGAVPDGSMYLATDQYGGTVYQMVAGAWVRGGAGATEGAKGLLSQAIMSAALNLALTGTPADIPGASSSFTYDGRPVRFVWRYPLSKFSIVTANQAIQLFLVDASGVGVSGAQNGVTQYQMRTPGLPTNATDVTDIMGATPSLSTFVNGTALVVGTTYTWKMQAKTSLTNGNWTAGYAANSAFYAHLSCYED